MTIVSAVLWLTGAYPLARAWRANRRTTLAYPVLWAAAAWAAWTFMEAYRLFRPDTDAPGLRYVALCLTGCAGVAVLGARRPGDKAWSFVTVGLLAVLLWQLVEGLGHWNQSPLRVAFVAGTLLVGVLNYLPTRLLPAALLLAAGLSWEFLQLLVPDREETAAGRVGPIATLLMAFVPWVALACLAWRQRELPEADRIWLAFRDRFGLVWGQRVREQFNRSAANAGWPVHLSWFGLRRTDTGRTAGTADRHEIVATLEALMKRFGPTGPGGGV